jgi:hypothetical protein
LALTHMINPKNAIIDGFLCLSTLGMQLRAHKALHTFVSFNYNSRFTFLSFHSF